MIWGRFEAGQLVTQPASFKAAPHVHCAALELQTLQQCRLFGPNVEVLLWHDGDRWQAQRITAELGDTNVTYLEDQLLWGTIAIAEDNGFTLVADGNEGLYHAVPFKVAKNVFRSDGGALYRPLRLRVQHVVGYDTAGVARVTLSRLVDVHIA